MSSNQLNTSQAQYPEIWSNTGCATCSFFSTANKTDSWDWKCEHPNNTDYVEPGLSSPRAECPGHYLSYEEYTKRVYTMRDLVQRDCGVEIVIEPINRHTIRINSKVTNVQMAVALLSNLYESHVNYKQALDRLNYRRHLLKIKDI